MRCSSRLAVTLIACALLGTCLAAARAADAPSKLSTRIYRVSDLVLPTPNYAFRGIQLPGLGDTGRGTSGSGMGPGGGMCGGMGGGGTGGGFFSVPQRSASGTGGTGQPTGSGGSAPGPTGRINPGPRPSFRFTMDDLVEAITATVQPDSWGDVGGEGAIKPLGGLLLVRNTAEVHTEVLQLLNAIRQEGGVIRSVTISARWLLVDAGQLTQLLGANARPGQLIAHKVLDLLREQTVVRGQVTCFDGQTVHIISGHVRSYVRGAIPVVGQIERGNRFESLARANGDRQPSRKPGIESTCDGSAVVATDCLGQVLSLTGGPAIPARIVPIAARMKGDSFFGGSPNVGYQPVVTAPCFGALLQVTPTLVPDTPAIILDVQNTVTRQSDQADTPIAFSGGAVDRLNLGVQQFRTTLRFPLGQPVLVGGMTFRPLSENAERKVQLYLVVEATLGASSRTTAP